MDIQAASLAAFAKERECVAEESCVSEGVGFNLVASKVSSNAGTGLRLRDLPLILAGLLAT